jgi:hypothetical protein
MSSSTTSPSNDNKQLLSDANGVSLEDKLDRFKMEESDVLPSDNNKGTAGEKGGSSLNNNCDDDPNIQHEPTGKDEIGGRNDKVITIHEDDDIFDLTSNTTTPSDNATLVVSDGTSRLTDSVCLVGHSRIEVRM